jgi:hypothetical protein
VDLQSPRWPPHLLQEPYPMRSTVSTPSQLTSTSTPRTLPNPGQRIYHHPDNLHTFSTIITQFRAVNLQSPQWPPHLLQEPYPIQGSESIVTQMTSTPTPKTLPNPGQQIYIHPDSLHNYSKNLTQSRAANLQSPRRPLYLLQNMYAIQGSKSTVTQMTSTPTPRTLPYPGQQIFSHPDNLHTHSNNPTLSWTANPHSPRWPPHLIQETTRSWAVNLQSPG